MQSFSLKNLSILKKFLFINFIVFLAITVLTLFYFNSVQPTLIKNKTFNHIKTLNNTIENLNRLKIKFNEEDIRKFLFSTKFLFFRYYCSPRKYPVPTEEWRGFDIHRSQFWICKRFRPSISGTFFYCLIWKISNSFKFNEAQDTLWYTLILFNFN